MKYFSWFLPILAVFILLPSCSGRINVQLAQNGSGSVQLQAGLEPSMVKLLGKLQELKGGSQSGSLLDAASLNRSLQAAPGIASSALKNSGQEKIEGTVGISRVGDLLNTRAARFINYEAPSGTTSGRLTIHLDRSIAPQILAQISPEAVDYLSALMAPAATGEVLSRGEYLLLVESVYGKALASEIATSRVTAAISLPGTVKSVKGGTSSGREARFNIPLTDLLVLEQPLDYEITW